MSGARVTIESLESRVLLSGIEIDPTFGDHGLVSTTVNAPSDDVAEKMAVQSDGKVVMVAAAGESLTLIRFNGDGSVDTGFGNSGLVVADAASVSPWPSIAIASDGKIIVGGGGRLMRFLPEGVADPSFGSAGIVDLHFSSNQSIWDIAAVPDGRVLAVAEVFSDTPLPGAPDDNEELLLLQYGPDGAPDGTFGTAGHVRVATGFTQLWTPRIAVQADSRIVVARAEDNDGGYGGDFIISRYNPDGRADLTFGQAGRASLFLPSDSGVQTNSIAIDPQGRILVGGSNGGRANCVLARFTPDGTPDSSFGKNGLVVQKSLTGPNGLAVREDGDILAATGPAKGSPGCSPRGISGAGQFGVAAFRTDGTLDSAFGQGGIVASDFGSAGHSTVINNPGPSAYATTLQLGPSGTVLAGGLIYRGPVNAVDTVLARYDNAGTLDASFGQGGRAFGSGIAPGIVGSDAVAVAQRDGKIVIAGSLNRDGSGSGHGDVVAVVRYNADGSLDAGFGSGGMAVLALKQDGEVDRLLVQRDGKILIATEQDFSTGLFHWKLFRLTSDGELDEGFGRGGRLVDVGDRISDVIIQNDGRILVMGNQQQGSHRPDKMVVARYAPDGTRDRTFGPRHNGRSAVLPVDPEGFRLFAGNRGRITAGGVNAGVALAHLDANGLADGRFGPDGVSHFAVAPSIGGKRGFRAVALRFRRNGELMLMVRKRNSTATAMYRLDGTLDQRYGKSGYGGIIHSRPNLSVLEVLPDQSIVTAGNGPGGKFSVRGWDRHGRAFGGTSAFVSRPVSIQSLASQAPGVYVISGTPPVKNFGPDAREILITRVRLAR